MNLLADIVNELAVKYLRKTLYLRCLTGFLKHLCD